MKNKLKKVLIIMVTLVTLVTTQVQAIGLITAAIIGFAVGSVGAITKRVIDKATDEMQTKPEATQEEIKALGNIMKLYNDFLQADDNGQKMSDLASETSIADITTARQTMDTVLLVLDNDGYKRADLASQANTTNIRAVMDKIIMTKKFLNALEDCIDKTGRTHTAGDYYDGILLQNATVDINDDYNTKLNYTRAQIVLYNLEYTRRNLSLNLDKDQCEAVKKIWKIKLDDSNTEMIGAGNISEPISDVDPVYTKMNYDASQIKLYITLYGWNSENIPKDPKLGIEDNDWIKYMIQTEWEYMLKKGYHSLYYRVYEEEYGSVLGWNDKLYTATSWKGYMSHVPDRMYCHAEADDDPATKYSETEESEVFWEKWNERKEKNELAIQNVNVNSVKDEEFYKVQYTSDEASLRAMAENLYQANDGDSDYDVDADIIFKMPERVSDDNATDAVEDAENFVKVTDETKEVFNEDELSGFSNSLYNMLLLVGIVLAVIVGMILGVKLMLAPVAEKAEAKKLLIPYAIGCAIVFGAFGIWRLVIIILQNI